MENSPHPRIRVAVALEEEGRLLLIRHQKAGKSYWLVPGGGVDYGESVRQAAIREMEEETGLLVQVGELVMVAESLAPDRSRHVVHLVFRGTRQGGEVRLGQEAVRPGEEQRLAELKWVTPEELSGLVLHPPFAASLREALNGKTSFVDNLWID